ncbi:hypothetical protein PI124_g20278 [Phytophthora idaei]|nr:hypothetical protein PI126_g17805 [Phytophthora idaei]KAG3234673.1 hypothetical protein PI124_g20278 [Phytophthora idaei]
MVAALIETVNELLENESSKTQEDTWMEKKLNFPDKRAAQKLAERNAATIQELKQLPGECILKVTDDTEVGKSLAERTEKKLLLEG